MIDQLTWNEVAMRHGSRAAVRLSFEGQVRSVLCGGPNHSDEVKDDSVDYSIPNRPYYSKVLSAFQKTLVEKGTFDVYCKVERNQWRDMGKFAVEEIVQLKSEHKIRLTKSE